MTSKELLGAVLGLPVQERARFARELILSLEENQGEADDEQELLEELDRRRAEVEAGQVRLMDRDEFDRALAQRRTAQRVS